MRWGSLLLLVALLGCERGGVRSVVGEVEVSARALHFERTFLGHPTRQGLGLRNPSRADRALTLTITGPFSTEREVNVPGGSQLQLAVRFEPLAEGKAEGLLTLSDGVNRFEVALDGEAVPVPACTPSAPCLTSAFDPLSGACVESAAADGASCVSTNACFLGGACVKGVCLGTARDCADTDRCTIDACDPAGGCVHLPASCAAPKDPCKVASCDPVRGCVETDAQDGTACGASDCSTARVCLLGQCKALPVPDGATCASASACQGQGICQQNVCQRPDPTPLVEAWSYDFPGYVSGFRGVTDSAENLYWVECAFGGLAGDYCNACTRCAATSFTRNGQLRFRQLLAGYVGYEPEPLHLIAGDQLVYAMPYSVGAVAIADGAPQWTRDFYAGIPNAPDVANFFEVKALAADATGIWVVGARYQGSAQNHRQSALLKLEPATGAVSFTRFFDGALTGAVVDEQNHLYLGFVPRSSLNPIPPLAQLVSLTASGAERWRVPLDHGADLPVGAWRGEVIVNGGQVRSALDGTLRAEAPAGALIKNVLIGSNTRTLLVDPPSPCCPTCPCPQIQPRVEAIRLASGSAAVDWQTNLASATSGIWGSVTDSIATRQGDLLIAAASYGNSTQLIALNSAGAKRFACEIPPTIPASPGTSSRYSSAVALLSGRWAAVEDIE
ncbi:MAG: putative lipoprotein, partial [Myxococcaceae bacterium]|nr:putative lipoprotein [Myxococcaceae bacterium]